WDANAPVMNHGSQYLTKDRQSHLYIEYHRGFEKVCQRIRAKYPKVIIQACASGGGRANYGVLPYFDEFWVSDDTDALQRIYMQWGTSYFFPAVTMASHISAAPNHQTFRTIPLKFRIDVAMSGRLGMEIQPKNMTEKEKALCKQAIKEYKQIRPIVQQGDIYRLLSPYEKLGCASMMYVKPDKSEAVFYWWKTETFCNQQLPRIPMAGLDPQKNYRVKELHSIDQKPLAFEGKVFSGAFLMANGLDIPLEHDLPWNERIDYASRVLYLVAE
ncbi:MAG: alpha-galactosidase, partial [Bacteroidaceae bacterium]|nr:alpha-galactosidase [Bacteroidaceae bacterium]